MRKKKCISVVLVIAMLLSVFQPSVFADKQIVSEPSEQIVREAPPSMPESDIPKVRLDSPEDAPGNIALEAASYASTASNSVQPVKGNLVRFRVDSGYDLDQYLFNYASPIDFTIDLKGFKPHPAKSSKVTLRVYDVDQNGAPGVGPEVDRVNVNGKYLGNLSGANAQWSIVTFNIPAGTLTSGENHFSIDIDVNNLGWAVQVDWAEIEIPFSIAQIEANAFDDLTIKRGKTDDIIPDKIWSTGFDANGNVLSKPSSNDPIADRINGGWLFSSPREFKYEYLLDSWPANARPEWEPVVKYSWSFPGTNVDSGGIKELKGWKNNFKITIPDKVGKYNLQVVLKIYFNNILLRTETRSHTLYVTLDSPKGMYFWWWETDTSKPKTAWLDISTKWASGQKAETDILKALNSEEYKNPLGWRYGYYDSDPFKENALTMIENGAGKNSDCYIFRDVWRILAATLGIKTSNSDYSWDGGFLTSTRPALDNNESANAFKVGASTADRWVFTSHAMGSYGGTLYDPTFGLTGTNKEGNIYAKYYDYNYDEKYLIFKELETPKNDVNVYFRNTSYNGWDQVEYKTIQPNSTESTVQSEDAISMNSLNALATASFTGSYNDGYVDADGNGMYEYLKFDVEVNAGTAGKYTLRPVLLDASGNLIALGSLAPGLGSSLSSPITGIELNAGSQYVPLYFSGKSIRESGADGPYTISAQLYDQGGSVQGEASFTTAAYTAASFQSGLWESIVISDQGSDTNGDGFFDFLKADMSFNALASGRFIADGLIFAGNTCIGSSTADVELAQGPNTISLNFDGKTIQSSGLDGPYTIYLTLGDQLYSAEFEHVTGSYSYSDFQTSDAYFIGNAADKASDTNGDSLYDELNVTAAVNSSLPGTYKVYGILEQESTGSFIESVEQTVALSGTPYEVALNFSGINIYNRSVDGPYKVTLVLTDENTNELSGMIHVTGAYGYTSFEHPKASFNRDFSDSGADTNGDGLFDSLNISTGININESGTYTIQGSLHDSDGNFITAATINQYLYAGTQDVVLSFNGTDISNHGADGPYNLMTLEIYQDSTGTINSLINAYSTNAYSCNDFQSSEEIQVNAYTDYGADTNQNGLFDALVVNMETVIPETGYYSYNARLVDSNGEEIIWASANQYLYKGTQNLTLRFDGRYIYGNGVDGPYELMDLSIYSGTQAFTVADAYTTNPYNHTDFEPCSIISGTVKAGDQPVENANIFINGVSSDLTNSSGIYRLKVLTSGYYTINIDADPDLSPWEIWVNGQLAATGTSATIPVIAGEDMEVNFTCAAIAPNQPPVLNPIGNITVNVNEEVLIALSATDPDNDTVTFSVYNEPEGALLDTSTGIFTWTPDSTQAGVYEGIRFTASDGELTDSEEITITVNDAGPSELIENLINYIEGLDLRTDLENRLTQHLELAQKMLEKKLYKPAIVQMKVFIIMVNIINGKDIGIDDVNAATAEIDELINQETYNVDSENVTADEKAMYDKAYNEAKEFISRKHPKKDSSLSDEAAEYLIKCAEQIINLIELDK